ncbi:uncharacterized protein B0H18DRAFT_1205696 [Fomitopsis serialis]|uniref:uncharacterized protein n=1 Tax=Fomitopsis serialis TaxID=139415 RepID=UPI0020075C42|nr:uncharacterized protein B0H18DRAFT_1205696 [Neoantrodia serialis]KAH9938463.1 hypothetical protein B0H18DRAFT_1205696 [Neoantrodia serialis]
MSLLRQRLATYGYCASPVTAPAASSHATDPEDTGPPKGETYPISNPIAINESKAAEVAQARLQGSTFALYCKSNGTNTIVSATRPTGHILRTFTGGSLGFKGTNRSSYEAGYQCATAAFQVLEKAMETERDPKWRLYLNGFGQGREAVMKAITSSEGED